MNEGIGSHPADPAAEVQRMPDERPQGKLMRRKTCQPVNDASVQAPEYHDCQKEEVAHKIAMVSGTNAVPNPGTVMVEPGDAMITERTVLGAKRPPYQARATEPGGVETVPLGQLRDRPKLLLLIATDDARVRLPGLVEVVEEKSARKYETDRHPGSADERPQDGEPRDVHPEFCG